MTLQFLTQYMNITRRRLYLVPHTHIHCIFHDHVRRWIAATATASPSTSTSTASTSSNYFASASSSFSSSSSAANQDDETKHRPRVVVAMSGGVDSSVAAHLLLLPKQQRNIQCGQQGDGQQHYQVQVDAAVDKIEMQQRQQQQHSADSCSTSSSTDVDVDVVGLHMSNWNALDEDSSSSSSDIEPPPKTNKSRRNHHHHHPSTKHGHSINNQARASTNTTNTSNPTSNNNNNGTSTFYCQASEQEYNDAKSVADHLSIPLHRVSFASEYWIQVFEPFVESIASVASGNTRHEKELEEDENKSCTTTPNPDFECNTYIKFGAMKEYAMDRLEADYVATGHYARLWHRNHHLFDSISSNSHQRNMHQYYGNSNNNTNDSFYEWMKETSYTLEQTVRESIAGRPEEEWILHNNTNNKWSGDNKNTSQYPMLIAGADRSKDQTYFLSGVKSEAFRNVLFPLGHLTKSSQTTTTGTTLNIEQQHDANENNNRHPQSVRDIATNANIPTASKRDSMGICFIGKRNFGNFVSQYLPESPPPGNFVDVDTGEIVGRQQHEGAVYYTIGQGAKISGASARYFVCGKGGDMAGGVDNAFLSSRSSSTVFVCNSTHHPALYTDELFVDFDAFNWIGLGESNKVNGSGGYHHNIPRPLLEEGASIELLARTRHLQPLASCRVSWDRSTNDGRGRQRLVVRFDKPMRAITPGQIVSLYAGKDGLICLGGGPIAGKSASFMDRGIDVSLSALHPSGHNDLSLGQYN